MALDFWTNLSWSLERCSLIFTTTSFVSGCLNCHRNLWISAPLASCLFAVGWHRIIDPLGTDGVVRTNASFVLVPLSVGVNVVAFLANVWLFKVWFSVVILLCVSFGIQSHFVYLFNVSILRLLAGFPVSQVHSLTELGCWMYAYFFLFRSVGFCVFQFYWANPFCFIN